MGCDIHLVVERRTESGWERVLPPPEARDKWLVEQAEKHPAGYYQKHAEVVWYDDRNYDCFAILANVRNGQGFAGCDTGDGFVPISEPRGFPADLSDGVQRLIDKMESDDEDEEDNDIWLGDHSHSWLTLAELLNYNWDQTTKKRGWVRPWNFEVFRREGRPHSWAGGISGASIEHISNREMAKRIDTGDIQWEGPEPAPDSYDDRPYSTGLQRSMSKASWPSDSLGNQIATTGVQYVTLVEWPISYKDAAGRFYSEFFQKHLVNVGPPDDVRIVFGFDS